MPDILSLNNLTQCDNLVYRSADPATQIDYSDGADTERYLHQVLSQATDLGSRSVELQTKIMDWPSEYHLSSDRANLLRPFDLSGVRRVLELGSGCGAISRYLGEQGIAVDAVEGSAIRAELGKLRCRDLDNVRVINANYNDLTFPGEHYDLVLFVGVIEYARKFHPDVASDRQAAVKILRQAAGYIHSEGAVLVAIENRLGLKYMLGAHEDHYGRRYVGINGYRDSAGIATYSRAEWQQLIGDAGFSGYRFSYPFPDYKIPRVVLSDDYVTRNRFASNHLEGLLSRDYYAPVKRAATETICWQAASQGGFLGDAANSFCLLMSNSDQALSTLQSFDFCHGPGAGRRNRYAVTTFKSSGGDQVCKRTEDVAHCGPDHAPEQEPDQGVRQDLQPQPLLAGNLLSGQWLRNLLIHVRREEFDPELRRYYGFLKDAEENGELAIDLLPINIIVGEDDGWQVFDQEWQVDWPLTPQYVLFRALLTFIVTNWIYLKDFLGWLELQTVRDFIEYGFHANMLHLSESLDQFIEQENRFQKAVARPDAVVDVREMLATVFEFSQDEDKIYPAISWRGERQEYADDRQCSIEMLTGPEPIAIDFTLAPATSIDALRLSPFDIRKADDVGFFRLDRIAVVARKNGVETECWSLESPADVMAAGDPVNAFSRDSGEGIAWIATTDFPTVEFKLDPPLVIEADADYIARVSMAVTRSIEYPLAYRHYLVAAREHQKKVKWAEMNLTAATKVSDHLKARLAAEEKRANRLQQDLDNTLEEIDIIKQSGPFRIGSRIVAVVERLRRLIPGAGK